MAGPLVNNRNDRWTVAMMRLLTLALLLGALAACSKKTEINEVVASVETTSLQLDKMIASARERKGSIPLWPTCPWPPSRSWAS